MQSQPSDRTRKILVGILVAVLVLGTLYLMFKPSKKATDSTASGSGKTNVYHDPVSGEDIVQQDDKSTEYQNSGPIPTFAGFGTLLDMGMTQAQLNSTYAAFQSYKPFANNKVLISLAQDDLQQIQPSDSDPQYRWSFTGHIVVDKKTTYKVTIYYWDVTTAQLVLSNTDGSQQVFDSGPNDTGNTANND